MFKVFLFYYGGAVSNYEGAGTIVIY